MADFIHDLATKSGVSPELAEKGVGAILEVFKDKLPAAAFSQVESAIPNASHLMEAAETHEHEEGSGGILSAVGGAVTGVVSKIVGGGTAAVMTRFTHLGFTADQLKSFVPNVLEFLKSKLPGDVFKQASALLPGAGTES
jgi:hypothetical protein